MQVVTPDVALPFEITAYDQVSSLTPALKVYEVTSGSPVLVSTLPMTHVINGTYWANFTPGEGKSYVANTAFYTDPGTYATPDTRYSPGSESFIASIDLISSRTT